MTCDVACQVRGDQVTMSREPCNLCFCEKAKQNMQERIEQACSRLNTCLQLTHAVSQAHTRQLQWCEGKTELYDCTGNSTRSVSQSNDF